MRGLGRKREEGREGLLESGEGGMREGFGRGDGDWDGRRGGVC